MTNVASSRGLLCFEENDRVWPETQRVGLCYWNDPHFSTLMSSFDFDYEFDLGSRFIWENRT
jgi:hypothetical protein